MNWKGCGSKLTWPDLRYYLDVFLEGLGKTTKVLSQDIRFPNEYLNPLSVEQGGGVLSIPSDGIIISS
jgi:hypothetical protein